MTITIRPFQPVDTAFILQLITRFSDFPLPAWRERTDIDRANQASLLQAMENFDPDSAILVAEDEESGPAGFIHLQTETDYFSGRKQGYISDIAVRSDHEGRGIGRILMHAAEQWAQERGYSLLTLYVFAGNNRARQMYEHLGFQPDLLKYAMPIEPPASVQGNNPE